MRQKIKIIQIIESLESRGAERVLVDVLKHLDKRRLSVQVCCLAHKGELASELEASGLPVFSLGKRPGLDPKVLPRLICLIRAQRYDIVHTHIFTANFWGRLAARWAGVPVVISHEHSTFALEHPLRRLINRLLAPWTDRILVVSEPLRKSFIRNGHLPKQKIEVLSNGVDFTRLERSRPFARSAAFVVGMVGALESRKDPQTFLEAARRVVTSHPEMEFWVVGGGPLRRGLEERARHLGLEDRVRFWGHRSDGLSLIKAMDCFVVPSRTEGQSIALLEAMALGRAIVATNIEGNRSLLRDNETALLVPPRSPEAMAEAIGQLYRDPQLRDRLGQRAQEVARRSFSIEGMARRLEDLYTQLCLSHRLCEDSQIRKEPWS